MKKLCCVIILNIFIFCCACSNVKDTYDDNFNILVPTATSTCMPMPTVSTSFLQETPLLQPKNKKIIFISDLVVDEREACFAVLGLEENKQYEAPEKLKVNNIDLEQYFFSKNGTQMLIRGEYYQFDDMAVGDQIQVISNQDDTFTATIISLEACFEDSTAAFKVFIHVRIMDASGQFNPQYNYVGILGNEVLEVPRIPLDSAAEIDLNYDGIKDKIIINPEDPTDWKIALSDGTVIKPKSDYTKEKIFCIADVDSDENMEIFFEDTFSAVWLSSIDNIDKALCVFPNG